MSSPQGVAFDPAGNLLIADTNNNRIRLLATDGTIATVAGTGVAGSDGDAGAAISATLRNPIGVFVDGAGTLYIADTNNQTLRRVGADGIISTVAGNGISGYNGDGSPATAYALNGPSAVTSAQDGSLIVADTQNQRLRQLSFTQ